MTLDTAPEEHSKFWDFIVARQRIWMLREAHCKPPWTEDPVLQRTHFTNVYRELDPGTKYAVENILNCKRYPLPSYQLLLVAPEVLLQEKLLNLMVYRLIGRESTHAALGWLRIEESEAWRFIEVLQEIRARGEPPFTGSYMVNSYASMGAKDKVLNVGQLLLNLIRQWPAFWDKVCSARSGGRPLLHSVLSNVYGWGGFLAFQVLVDGSYPLPDPLHSRGAIHTSRNSLWQQVFIDDTPPAGNDGYVYLGPGARHGVKRLFPAIGASNAEEHNAALAMLRKEAWERLAERGFQFLYTKQECRIHPDCQRVVPSSANLVNCLCEYDKYVRYSASAANGRKFDDVAAYRRDREALGHGKQLGLMDNT